MKARRKSVASARWVVIEAKMKRGTEMVMRMIGERIWMGLRNDMVPLETETGVCTRREDQQSPLLDTERRTS